MDFILTHKDQLSIKYGKKNTQKIIKAINKLVKKKKGKLIFIDQLKNEPHFNFNHKFKPDKLRKYINSIDKKSDKNTFLLIGGHSIIPFYKVKNPVNDQDTDILSDAPYASSDDDFLIPERIVGRIPDSAKGEHNFLIGLLHNCIDWSKADDGYRGDFGYSASVWKKASRSVYKTFADADKLKISPPLKSELIHSNWLKKRILYFNLHGSKESPSWYGQRAVDDDPQFPFYPVAISPANIPSLSGTCVFTEACYGAWIFDKLPNESLALKILEKGSIAFVGSTAIAYGPPVPPSMEADLLGKHFFKNVMEGIPFGEAFKEAKIDFATEMLETQGFLDSDDKKTLLEFQLYGDPSLKL
jgi:hypothetical protein